MPRRFAKPLLMLAAAGLVAGVATAQDGDDKSRFERTLESMISTPDRLISITGLEGALSSNPTAERITISDRQGPWLEIEEVAVVWNRTALFRRVLDIDSLRAERVTMLRKPAAAEGPQPEGSAALPVDVTIDAFTLPEIAVAPPVAGTEAHLSAEGSAEFTEGVAAARLQVLRKDRPGRLSAELRLEPEGNALTADLQLAEPAGGFLADLLELRGRPAVTLTLAGTGPLADWQADLQMEADESRVLSGAVTVSRADAGYRITGDLAAALETVAPERYAALLAGDSRLAFDVLRGDAGAIEIRAASLKSEGVDLAASGTLSSDLVPERGDLSLRLGQAGRTGLPFAPGHISVAALEADIGLDAGAAAPWRAEITAQGLQGAFGSIGGLAFTASGQASNLAVPAERATTFRLEGSAENVQVADAELAAALGPTVRLSSSGSWSAGQPITFESLEAVLAGATASFTGTATAAELQGRFGLGVTDISRLAGLTGRPLAGGARLQANGSLRPADGGFDLQLDGEADDLRLGMAALDPLLAGTTRVQGGIARSDAGLRFDQLVLANEGVSAKVTGSFAEPELDLAVDATLADLSSLSPRAAGQASVSARVTGTADAPRVEAEASGDAIELMGRPLENASARFSGIVAGPNTEGEAELSATLDGVPVEGSTRLSAGEAGARTLDDLVLAVGQSRLAGDLVLQPGGFVSGNVEVVSPDLSQVAPLFLVEASGMLRADVSLSAANGGQSASFSGTAADLVYEDVTLESAEIDGAVSDLFSAPQIEGKFSVRNLNAGGLHIVAASGTAARAGASTSFDANATLADGSASAVGSLEPRGNGVAIPLQSFSFSRAGIDLSLAEPTTVVVENGVASFDATAFRVDGGSLRVTGSAGSAFDLTVALDAVPAGLVNSLAPELAAEGTVSGAVTVSGTPADPAGRFDLQWQGGSVAATRNAGLGPLGVTAEGTFQDGTVQLTSRVEAADGLSATISGTIGTAAGAPLALRVRGTVPLSLGNRQLAGRGAALQGVLNVDVAVTGTAADPQFSGRITAAGAGFVDPETGIVLRNIALSASLAQNRIVIDRLTAASGEGTVTASGSVGLDPGAGFPLDVKIRVDQGRYVDGTLVAARVDADLTVTGSLTQGPVLGGTVFVDRAEITVPESLPRDSVAVDVEHVNTPPDVERTVALARERGRRSGADGGEPRGIHLDLVIQAPQQVFVRGRGVDAELGGELRLSGPASSIVAAGAFELIRGRFDIFTQRIIFDRGTATFTGDLDPLLDLSGTTDTQDITVTVTVTGPASDPEVLFSSVPELPQDEVLAHLIFNKGIAELSPVQIARLASVASGGLLDQLRESTGLDDLDVVVDEEGAPALAAGRYVSENVYVGVQQGATAESSRVTIDLDITKDVKARAAVSPQGDSSLGIFFEHEY
jgi:translocation and assembly module TamB